MEPYCAAAPFPARLLSRAIILRPALIFRIAGWPIQACLSSRVSALTGMKSSGARLFSPRLAATWSPPGAEATTKLSAGIGLYYEHTQLEYLERALAGVRYDTYYAADGVTPVSGPLETIFTANDASLKQTRTINWSVGIQRKLPGSIYAGANFLQKRTSDGFVYANQQGSGSAVRNSIC